MAEKGMSCQRLLLLLRTTYVLLTFWTVLLWQLWTAVLLLLDADPPHIQVPYMVTGNYIYVAGQLPIVDGEIAYKGKVPSQRSEEEAYKSARACGLNIIAQVNAPTEARITA